MAGQPPGESNQPWRDTVYPLSASSSSSLASSFNTYIGGLETLSKATLRRNIELEQRVGDLERQLEEWRLSSAVSKQAAQHADNAHKVQLEALNKQISAMRGNQNHLIVCVINGDQCFFERQFLVDGYRGGMNAAAAIRDCIGGHLNLTLDPQFQSVITQMSFWVTIYLNKSQLAEDLVANDICSQEQFEAFLTGFTHASPRFVTVDVGDVGQNNEALRLKIGEHLKVFSQFPQVLRVFFGGFDPHASMTPLVELNNAKTLDKLVLLEPVPSDTIPRTSFIDLGLLSPVSLYQVKGIFRTEKLPQGTGKLTPLASTGSYSGSVTSNGGLISPKSPQRPAGHPIDPSLPLHKQNPPPCNEFYLMTCSKGSGVCKYSHDYNLTPEQLVSLANNAKKAPCNWLKNGMACPFGDKCCWGHVCPNGPKCFHLSKGKCWFKGEAMHPET